MTKKQQSESDSKTSESKAVDSNQVAAAALKCVRQIYGCGNLAAAQKLSSLPSEVVAKIGELELKGERAKVLSVIAAAAVQIAEAKIEHRA